MRSLHAVSRSGALLACLAFCLPSAALAQDYTCDLVLTAKLQTGEVVDLPGFPYVDYFDCVRARDKTQIGRKFPSGTIVSADGKSPSGTIVSARCVQRLPKPPGT